MGDVVAKWRTASNLWFQDDQLVLAAHPANLALFYKIQQEVKKVLVYGDRQPCLPKLCLHFDMIDAQPDYR